MAELEEVKVVVMGGAGFFGSEVVKQLSRYKAQVTVLDDFSSRAQIPHEE